MAKYNLANLNYLFNGVAFIHFNYLSYTRFSSLFNKYYFTGFAHVARPTCQQINSDPHQICGIAIKNNFILEHNKEIIEHLGSYLAGLIEGDGYISITNENRRASLSGITFNIKDNIPKNINLINNKDL